MESVLIDGIAYQTPAPVAAEPGCTRSHPHENMGAACKVQSVIAEMRNMDARGAEVTGHQLDEFADALASAAAPAVAAIVFEHEDGRYAVNPDTTGDPAWHRLGPVDISALAASPQPAYGATEFGWTDYRQLEDGDKRLIALVVSLYGNDHQSSSDLEDLLGRASHGQAPASKIEGLTAAQESLGVEFENVLHDNLFDLYEESAPHGQAPAQAAPDVSGYVSEWSGGLCTSDEAMDGIAKLYGAQAAPTTQPAPQQEVQEPGWVLVPAEATDAMMAAFAKAADADVDWHNATESDRQDVRDGFCPAYRAMLRAAPQPSPAPQGDALDAARYHYLRDVSMERWPAELLTAIRLQQNDKLDAAIDAARAAQEGKG